MTASATPWPVPSRLVKLRARGVCGAGRARWANFVTRVAAGAPVEEALGVITTVATGRASDGGAVLYAAPEADVGAVGDVNPGASAGRAGSGISTRWRGRSGG